MKVNLAFRNTFDNYANLLPQTSKDIKSNFNKKFEMRSTNRNPTLQSQHNYILLNTKSISNNTHIICGVYLVHYFRCYVEDYMLSEIVDPLLILVPSSYIDKKLAPWFEIINSDVDKSEIFLINKHIVQ